MLPIVADLLAAETVFWEVCAVLPILATQD
jgi:hypothetical protein